MPHRAQRNLQFSATGYTEQRLRTPAVEPQHAFFTVVERDNNRQDPGKDLSNSDSNPNNITAPDVANRGTILRDF